MPHRHSGIFIAKSSKEDTLVTKNMVPGKAVYGEKLIKVDGADGAKEEYRVWNPFRSKLAAAVLGGVANIWIAPGMKVLYLGAASGTSVSHVSDVVGPQGVVYAVEFSHRSGRDLVNMAKNRPNVVPIGVFVVVVWLRAGGGVHVRVHGANRLDVDAAGFSFVCSFVAVEDARHPLKYRMLVSMVDVVFADVAQPDRAFSTPPFVFAFGCVLALIFLIYFFASCRGPNCGVELSLLPEDRRTLCHFHQSQLH